MQVSVERSATKWVEQGFTKTWNNFAWEPGQERRVAPPESPADGRALICNIIFIVHGVDDKGTDLHIQGHFPGAGPGHRTIPEGSL